MIQGLQLQDLAQKLENTHNNSRDFMVQSQAMRMEDDMSFTFEGDSSRYELTGNDNFHSQVAAKLSIPTRYYNRMMQHEPDLLVSNVNRWMGQEPATRMVRTVEGGTLGRAYLSENYRPLDNIDLINEVLPVLHENEMEILSCDVTDKKLYIQARSQRTTLEVAKGDPVQAGVIITNSETGHGALDIRTLIYRLVCTNGMVSGDQNDRFRKIHSKRAEGLIYDKSAQYVKSDTMDAMDKAFWLSARDALQQSIKATNFEQYVQQMKRATKVQFDDPQAKVLEITRSHGIRDEERKTVMKHLIEGGDSSMYGIINAVTRTAQDMTSYDRAIEFEEMGGKLLQGVN